MLFILSIKYLETRFFCDYERVSFYIYVSQREEVIITNLDIENIYENLCKCNRFLSSMYNMTDEGIIANTKNKNKIIFSLN